MDKFTNLETAIICATGLYHGTLDADLEDNMNFTSLGLLSKILKGYKEQQLAGGISSLIKKDILHPTGDKCNMCPKYEQLILTDKAIKRIYSDEELMQHIKATEFIKNIYGV